MPTEITSFSLQDFVAGLAAIRKREPSIEELVFQHEIAGDYGDALACYESMGKGRYSIGILLPSDLTRKTRPKFKRNRSSALSFRVN